MPEIGHKLHGLTVAYSYYDNDTASGSIGVDGTDSDKLKISALATQNVNPTTAAQIIIDPAANGDVTIDPNGSGDTVLQSGDLTVVAGDINMPTSSSTVGVYNINGTRFMHNFDTQATSTSTFLGLGAGVLSGAGTIRDNTGIGYQALQSVTNLSVTNVAVGATALATLARGTANVAVGYGALTMLNGTAGAEGSENTAVGHGAGDNATLARGNTLIGQSAGNSLTTGSENVLIGQNALYSGTTGNFNVIIGSPTSTTDNPQTSGAGYNYTTSESSNIIISNAGVVGESNVMRLGTTGSGNGQVNATYIAGIDGVNVGSVAEVVTMGTGGAANKLGTAVITAGSGITVTPGANTITLAATATTFTWAVTTIDAGMVVNNGYIANKAGLLTMTLPASGAIGDILRITGINTAVGWRIAQNAGQIIHFGASSTTTGIAGYLEATAIRDSAELVCVVAGASAEWNVLSAVGNLTVV